VEQGDECRPVRLAQVKLKKLLFTVLGSISLVLGAAGVVLPLLPTTPLVLLAAYCFQESSEKIHNILVNNRIFGPYIENYRTKRGISLKRKAASIAFLWAGLAGSMIVLRAGWAYVLLGAVGVGVTAHLVMIPKRDKFNTPE
jgi:hypothetical protein